MHDALNYTPYLCAGAVVLMADELSGADRQDGLDALLYSQTVASHKFPDIENFEPWANAGKRAVRTLGGMLLSEPNISLPAPLQGSFSLEALALQTLRQLAVTANDRSFETGLKALSQCESISSQGRLLRESVLHEDARVLFRFGVISPGLTMMVAAVSFAFDETIEGNILGHPFTGEKVLGNVSISGYRALVEQEDYDLSRATVISLLGERRQAQIKRLTCVSHESGHQVAFYAGEDDLRRQCADEQSHQATDNLQTLIP